MSALLLLLACTPVALVEGVRFEDSSEDPSELLDSEEREETNDLEIFQLDRVVEIELILREDDLDALAAEPYAYVQADVRIDEQLYEDVGVRLKGRLGSFRAMPSKSAFKIDFKQYGGPEGPDDLEKLNLNNMVQDCAQAHKQASYGLHEMLGIPAPRVAYAWVKVNEANYGLYSLVDAYDDEFLKRRFEDPSGNLYDGDYRLWDDGSYTLVDFTNAQQHLFELDEGTDVGLADIEAVTLAAGKSMEDLAGVVDTEQLGRFIGASAWTGQYDSYAYYSNNYRVYFDPAREGRGVFLPWDPDWAFYASTPVTSPNGRLAALCLADGDCRGHARAAADELSRGVAGSTFEEELIRGMELTEEYVEDDRKREVSLSEVRWCREDLLDWLQRRESELDAAGF